MDIQKVAKLLDMECRKKLRMEDAEYVASCYGAPYFLVYFPDGTVLQVPEYLVSLDKMQAFLVSNHREQEKKCNMLKEAQEGIEDG